MSAALALDWVLDPPRETLIRSADPAQPLPGWTLVLFSEIFSAALAECVMAPLTIAKLPLDLLLYGSAALLMTFLFQRISSWFSPRPARFAAWLRSAAIVLLPVELLFPAALLFSPAHAGGLICFELFKWPVLYWILRRGTWAVEHLNGWPRWAAVALLLSPYVLALLGIFLLIVVGLFAVLALVLGSLS